MVEVCFCRSTYLSWR